VLHHSAMPATGRANTHTMMISEGGPPHAGGPPSEIMIVCVLARPVAGIALWCSTA
jgi:hypothetical protein